MWNLRRWMRGSLPALIVVPLATIVAGCDPCYGVATCGDYVVGYEGQLLYRSGLPAARAQITFVHRDGVKVEVDSASFIADEDGRYVVRVRADRPGEVTADIVITPRQSASFRVNDVPLFTTRRRDLLRFPTWVADPQFSYLFEVVLRADGSRARNSAVQVQHIEGSAFSPDPFTASTDDEGRFWFHPDANAPGETLVRLSIAVPGGSQSFESRDVRLASIPTLNAAGFVHVELGPSIRYVGSVRYDSGEPAEDIEVRFMRTSGLQLLSDELVVRTNGDGLFPLRPSLANPAVVGEVVGDLSFRANGASQPVIITDVHLATFEADDERLAGRWTIPAP